MNNYIIFAIIALFIAVCLQSSIEGLRIQGSHDIRGDPTIPYNPFVGPWNIGTSVPIRNRPMDIESFDYEFYRPPYDYDSKVRRQILYDE